MRKGSEVDNNEDNKSIDDVKSTVTKLYPNPNSGSFEITLGTELVADANIQVIDIYGKVVYTTNVKTTTFAIDIPNLSTGVYFVQISNAGLNETVKFIKQ